MASANYELVNSCRVCRHPNQDGDYECLYETQVPCNGVLPLFSSAGKLYEELLGELSPETYELYPRYVCNSCDLQMRLFKKLKDKALKTMEYLSQIYFTKKDLQLNAYEQDCSKEEVAYENNTEMNYNLHNSQIELELESILEKSAEPDQQQLNELKHVLNQTDYEQELSLNLQEQESLQQSLEIHSQHDENTVGTTSVALQVPLKVVIPETGDIVVPENEQTAIIDKSDYVMEIYEMIEDGSQTMHSEIYIDGEEMEDDEFHVEEEEESEFQMDSNEEMYLDSDELQAYENNEHDLFKTSKQQGKGIKRKLSDFETIREYQCTECKALFTSAKEFKHHRENVHAQVYSCKICFKTFKYPNSLPTHMKIHDKTPAFQCELCHRTFTQKIHFQYHMKGHNNIRNYKCEECGKGFIDNTDLKVHMRRHNGERPYVCDVCGKDYKMSEHLKTHALTHTGQQFPCDVCFRNFSTPKTLRQHKLTIHSECPKFICALCKKSYRRKHHLQYHMKQAHPMMGEAFYEENDDPEEYKDEEDAEVNVEDDDDVDDDLTAAEQWEQQLIQDPGFVALND